MLMFVCRIVGRRLALRSCGRAPRSPQRCRERGRALYPSGLQVGQAASHRPRRLAVAARSSVRCYSLCIHHILKSPPHVRYLPTRYGTISNARASAVAGRARPPARPARGRRVRCARAVRVRRGPRPAAAVLGPRAAAGVESEFT